MSADATLPERIELDAGPVSAVDLALYAAASGDHNPLHLDDEVARAAGFDKPLVHGMLSMAYAARLFTGRFGASSVKAIATRFVGVAWRGDRLHFGARLLRRDGASATYEFTARTEDGRDVVAGTADVIVPTAT